MKLLLASLFLMHAEVKRALASDFDFLGDVVAPGGQGQAGAHAATTRRCIAKLSGRSVVCWVPLGTPIPPFISSYLTCRFSLFISLSLSCELDTLRRWLGHFF